MPGRFKADPARLLGDIEAPSTFGEVGPTAITRLAFTPEDNDAHRYVEQLMCEARSRDPLRWVRQPLRTPRGLRSRGPSSGDWIAPRRPAER